MPPSMKTRLKGVNILERGSQVHFMAEFQELLDFPPAPKLDVFGKLDEAAQRVGQPQLACGARTHQNQRRVADHHRQAAGARGGDVEPVERVQELERARQLFLRRGCH